MSASVYLNYISFQVKPSIGKYNSETLDLPDVTTYAMVRINTTRADKCSVGIIFLKYEFQFKISLLERNQQKIINKNFVFDKTFYPDFSPFFSSHASINICMHTYMLNLISI